MAAAADMIGLAIKAMGIDPKAILSTADSLGRAFGVIGESCQRQEAALARLEASQLAIMAHLGLTVPPPTDEQADIIAAESRRYGDQFGGLLEHEGASEHASEGA